MIAHVLDRAGELVEAAEEFFQSGDRLGGGGSVVDALSHDGGELLGEWS